MKNKAYIIKNFNRIQFYFGKFKLKLKLPMFLSKKDFQKEIVANSPYWDDLWYVQKYGYDFTREEALDYWCRYGWKNGESPSKYINMEACLSTCPKMNPIVAYHSKQVLFLPDYKNNYKEENDAQRIKEYLEYKQTRQAKLQMIMMI